MCSLNELVLHQYSNYKYNNYLILENTVEQIETPFQLHQAKLNCSCLLTHSKAGKINITCGLSVYLM